MAVPIHGCECSVCYPPDMPPKLTKNARLDALDTLVNLAMERISVLESWRRSHEALEQWGGRIPTGVSTLTVPNYVNPYAPRFDSWGYPTR